MFQKFRGQSDNALVLLYKKGHQDDLEFEIISRYQRHARHLAGSIYSKFKFLYQVEFDDIYCILLSSLFNSIRAFNDSGQDFYQYWKASATNDALNYIGGFSQNKTDLINSKTLVNDDSSIIGVLRQRPENLSDDYLSLFGLDDILEDPKNKFSREEIDVFRLFLAGYTCTEIASLTSNSYDKIRYRLDRVKKRIRDILFNQ